MDEGETAPTRISGEELVGLFTGPGVGGFIPRLVFLSACHSGSLVSARDWDEMRAMLRDPEGFGATREAPELARMIAEGRGYTGTALSLLRAGVQQVVAMRYEVGDSYARRLARRFYRNLLADSAGHAVDAALAMARTELAADPRAKEHFAVDHATPLVFGADPIKLVPKARRSAQMSRQEPKPQPLLASESRELAPPHGFVGRGAELERLGRKWLRADGVPIAIIQGLAGLGKTALAAESIHLGYERFDYVLAFQARGGPLPIEELYRQMDQRLALASPVYRERCEENELAKIYLPPGRPLSGAQREEALRNNLIEVMRCERILLVLDNFETNLRSERGLEGYAASDPAWDRLLEELADRLRESGSRVLITSRHRPAAPARGERMLWVYLGPLPVAEAMLFFEGCLPLRELWYGHDADARLAQRILDVSRGHPLILGTLADVARAHFDEVRGALRASGRTALKEALDRIQGEGYRTLPDLFSGVRTEEERERERGYLEDVAVGAVDLLLERLRPEARTLLWVITRASEPVPEEVLEGVWSGTAGAAPEPEALVPLLEELRHAGLVHIEGDEAAAYGFHELVAEQAAEWMGRHPDESGGRTEEGVWKVYGELYGAVFKAILGSGKPGARDAASEAGGRGIRYLVRARDFEGLGAFASSVVIEAKEPMLLERLVADLQAAAEQAPAGEPRWNVRTCLADALSNSGRSDEALSLFEEAAREAEAAGNWKDVAWICHNWAITFRGLGQLDRAKVTHARSVEAKRRAGLPRLPIVASELEVLRVEVMQGQVEQARATIDERLGEVRAWWEQRRRGESVADAPNDALLARTLAGGLNIACQADLALERWQGCLDLSGEIEELERTLGAGELVLANTRFNQYRPLIQLDRLTEAKQVVEGCLEVFRRAQERSAEAIALSALAHIWDELGNVAQAIAIERAALDVHERLPNPAVRGTSQHNLSSYLHKAGYADEAAPHWLAGLVYPLATGHDQLLSLKGLPWHIHQASTRGERFDPPRLSDLLARPAFAPLRAFLAERGVAADDLQPRIDALIEQVRAQLE